MTISQDLQTKIDALQDEKLKANILRVLNSPGTQTISDEQIFENMVKKHHRVMAERATRAARLYKWRDDEVLAFIGYFQEQQPQLYTDYLNQERSDREIDADLAWNIRRISEQWLPGLDWEDYGELFGKVREYANTNLI